MEQDRSNLLCCPRCKGELSAKENAQADNLSLIAYSCPGCNKVYTTDEGYLDFLGDNGLVFSSRREKVIRSIYAKVYTPVNNFLFLFCGGAKSARREVLSAIELEDGASVLETGMGTGDNFLWLSRHAKDLKFFGIDIQKQMMMHSMNNLERWGIHADLFRADAVELPFKDNLFDVVFHLGAFNLFSDKKQALEEMIRVIKPGKKIVIADETDKASKYFNMITGGNEKVVIPTELVPKTMLDIQTKIIWRGFGYLVTFVKPGIS